MAATCLAAYWLAMYAFAAVFPKESNMVGAMWAAIGAVFVFRDSRGQAFTAGVGRLRATFLSFALCLIYLMFYPPSAIGMAVVTCASTLVVGILRWPQDAITAAVTTIVLMVLAQLDPASASYQPALRFIDTLLGVAVGLLGMWLSAGLLPMSENQ